MTLRAWWRMPRRPMLVRWCRTLDGVAGMNTQLGLFGEKRWPICKHFSRNPR